MSDCLSSCHETHDLDCPEHVAEAAYWRGYFGVHPRMTRDERREQLERMRPSTFEPQRMSGVEE